MGGLGCALLAASRSGHRLCVSVEGGNLQECIAHVLAIFPAEAAATKRNPSGYTETHTVTVSSVLAVFVAAKVDRPKRMLLEQPVETFALDASTLRSPRHVAGELRHQRNQVVV